MSNRDLDLEKQNFANLPIGKNEDVEFSEENADDADRIAMKRAEEADARVQTNAKAQAQRLL
ncbi:YfhD family protein [Paenibacillus sp. R14(2021)]|uniref:YfhD family protein n=1 Tax=Paenibacillus sp. R14(2021) TaxID=2859228 RepID=UPI001C615572|nr:YfhD family protein [Paenibacillus sp. R14(2021)]